MVYLCHILNCDIFPIQYTSSASNIWMGETDILQFESIVNISRLCIDWRQCGLGWAAAPAPTLNIPQLENWVVSHPTPGSGTVRDNTQTHSKYNNYLELKCVSLLSSEAVCCDDTQCGLGPIVNSWHGWQRHAVLQTDQNNVSCSDWWYGAAKHRIVILLTVETNDVVLQMWENMSPGR